MCSDIDTMCQGERRTFFEHSKRVWEINRAPLPQTLRLTISKFCHHFYDILSQMVLVSFYNFPFSDFALAVEGLPARGTEAFARKRTARDNS